MQNLRIAAVQANIVWQNKKANFSKYEALLADVEPCDLMVLPEMFQTGFNFDSEFAESLDNSNTLQWLEALAKRKKCVVTGSFMVQEGEKLVNRLIWMRPDGSYEYYDKRHLFSMSDEPKHFSAGDKKIMVELNGWKICPMVCYDLRFPVWTRNTEAYDVFIVVANWPERRSQHWAKLLEARAIENQCYVIGVNRVGQDGNDVYHDGCSAIINPMGEIMKSAIHDEVVIQTALDYDEIVKIRRYMPFLKDADAFKML